jgi:RHS repeat-associated protein
VFTSAHGSNQLAASQVGAPVETFSYDPHGNLLSMPHLPTLGWNVDNHLHSVDLGAGSKAFYSYDSDGHRIHKVVQRPVGIVEERLYLGLLEIFRRSVNGVVTLERESFHVLDRDRRLAIVDTRTAGDDTAVPQLIRYQFSNHLGSATLEVDDLGAVIGYEEYYPFGSSSFQSVDSAREVPAKRYRYTGKERDEESGLYYHGSRYYVPWLARWNAPDPLGIKDGNNLYLYAGNRPIGSSDPTGMWETPGWARTAAIVAAVVVVAVVVTVATAGVGTAALGAAIGAAGLTGGAATAATVAGTVAVGAVAGGVSSLAATATAQGLTGTYHAPGAAEARSAAWKSGALAGAVTGGVGAALGAVTRGGVAGARAAQTAAQATRTARAAQVAVRAGQGALTAGIGGVTQEASRQVFSGEHAEKGGFDWGRIGTQGAIGAAAGGLTSAVAGPALGRAGNRLFEAGYRGGLKVGSPAGRAAFFGPISKATGQNFVISALGEGGGGRGETPRPVIALATPRGPEAWYVRSGQGGISAHGAQSGKWAPFQGIAEKAGAYVGPDGKLNVGQPGWWVKVDSTAARGGAYRWGNEGQAGTATQLGKWRIPVSEQPASDAQINAGLRAAGVPLRQPDRVFTD